MDIWFFAIDFRSVLRTNSILRVGFDRTVFIFCFNGIVPENPTMFHTHTHNLDVCYIELFLISANIIWIWFYAT